MIAQACSLWEFSAGAQPEGLSDYLEDVSPLPGPGEWAEECARPGSLRETLILGNFSSVIWMQAYLDESLSLMLYRGWCFLDECVLQQKSLHLGVGDDEVQAFRSQDQGLGPGTLTLFLEIIADTSLQIAGFAYIEDGTFRVQEEVASGKMWKRFKGDHTPKLLWSLVLSNGGHASGCQQASRAS